MLSDEYCPIYINWNIFSRRRNDLQRIHWCYTRALWQRGTLVKKAYFLSASFTWPLRAIGFAWKRTKHCGPQVKQKTGDSLTRQFVDQLYLALRYFIPPRAYYLYGLYDPTNRNLASKYIHHHEIIELLPFLNASNDSDVLHDKRRFSEECIRQGLPTIPIIAEVAEGKFMPRQNGTDIKLPKSDLFAKPAAGVCGHGVRRWIYEKSGRYLSDDGHLLTQDQVIDQLLNASHNCPYILQKRIVNHPDIAGLSTGGLCTVRVVTCRPPKGPPVHLESVFRMPTNKAIADNFESGGIACPVMDNDGRLGKAIAKDLLAVRTDRHPDTGIKIDGVRIPFWNQVIQLCLTAHNAFSDFASVGWDVAITENGPVLVEGNPTWCVELLQRTNNRPLGASRFADLFVLHLENQESLESIE